MQHDAWFFVGVFAFIFLIWIATGGPTHPIAFSGPTLALPGQLGGGTYLGLPRAPFALGGSSVTLSGSSGGGGSAGVGYPSLPSSYLGSTSFGTPSSFRGLVSISHYISGADADDPRQEYVEITVLQNAGQPVDLSGWSVRSEVTGSSGLIGKGVEIPSSGIVNAAQDIVLLPGEHALIVSGQSPIGYSFKENKCVGYLAQFQPFSPPISQICPDPIAELPVYYGANDYLLDQSCVDFVKTLPRCTTTLSPPPGLTNRCRLFLIQDLTYNSCVSEHRRDDDFSGDTWRVYLGRTTPLFKQKDEVVRLLDAQGKTVDVFSF